MLIVEEGWKAKVQVNKSSFKALTKCRIANFRFETCEGSKQQERYSDNFNLQKPPAGRFMLTNEEVHYCSNCSMETKHIVVLVRDEPVQNKVKDFLNGFIKSAAVGAFEATMDDFSRHSICEKCGKKTINDNLT